MTLQTILTAQKLAQSLDVPAPRGEGDATRPFRGVAPLASAGPDEVSFAAGEKHLEAAGASRAGLILCEEPLADPLREAIMRSDETARIVLPVPSVWAAAIHLLNFFHPEREAEGNIHPSSAIAGSAVLNDPVDVGPWTDIGEGVEIGANCVIGARCSIGAGARIGPGCRIAPGVYIHGGTEIGARCRIGPGAAIGADGFRYERVDGASARVPQIGRVVIEDDVDIGANTAIDRAAFEETRIGARTKIDNLVQIGHNVIVGPDCILCAQVGIAGSTRLGRGVVMAGQVGVADHVSIADGSVFMGRAGIAQSIEKPGVIWFGTPCEPYRDWFRKHGLLARLGDLGKTVKRLEKKIEG